MQKVALSVGTKVAWPDQYHRASYEGDYVESTTSITTDARAHNFVTRDNKLKEDAPSSVDSNEPDKRKA